LADSNGSGSEEQKAGWGEWQARSTLPDFWVNRQAGEVVSNQAGSSAGKSAFIRGTFWIYISRVSFRASAVFRPEKKFIPVDHGNQSIGGGLPAIF
jgi:hypothetical protein